MPVKEWFRKLQPMQLYIVLTLTIVFFVAELVMSHITHSLTLLMDSYHVLCNIFALAGCIITIKVRVAFKVGRPIKKCKFPLLIVCKFNTLATVLGDYKRVHRICFTENSSFFTVYSFNCKKQKEESLLFL